MCLFLSKKNPQTSLCVNPSRSRTGRASGAQVKSSPFPTDRLSERSAVEIQDRSKIRKCKLVLRCVCKSDRSGVTEDREGKKEEEKKKKRGREERGDGKNLEKLRMSH
ncbi:Hypothetical predicted protein [Xyrichtys novacula]|uniref:Uncharacterized protein n=1 Tax=Xyrichtys novacula TaxID=13765 RepID=A0AAV1GTY4_XYRNO|nr:Hypothetical predicted protein [Xyrichtys novacula]